MKRETNSFRVLAVDDNLEILKDYQKILSDINADQHSTLDAAIDSFFGKEINVDSDSSSEQREIDITSVPQGAEAVDLVHQAQAEGQPFSVAFIDVRMPPGIDGVETAKRIWSLDPEIQIVIVSAYSDYDWEKLRSELITYEQSNLMVLRKPFDVIEVKQMAWALSEKWRLSKTRLNLINELEQEVDRRAQAQASLTTAVEIAERANMAKNDFLSLMSHELRTPLNGMVGGIELLKNTDLTKDQTRYTKMLSQSLERANHLFKSLLEFCEFANQEVEIKQAPFQLSKVLRDAIEPQLSQIEEKGLRLIKDYSEQDVSPILLSDQTRLSQILINLIENAIRFTPEGSITLAPRLTRNKKEDQTSILSIEIRDTGIGIPEEHFRRIFAPFEQSSRGPGRSYQGAGLGLAICKKCAEILGGTIDVQSKIDVGTTFKVELPVTIVDSE